MSTPTLCQDCKPEVAHSSYFHFGSVVKNADCGCEISGSGNLPDPWHIHYCALHAQAPGMRELLHEQVKYAEHCPMGQLSVLGIDWMNVARALLAQIEKGA